MNGVIIVEDPKPKADEDQAAVGELVLNYSLQQNVLNKYIYTNIITISNEITSQFEKDTS